MWGFPREHIRIFTLSPFLPDLLSDQQITYRKDILNFAFFLTWRVASSRHSSPVEGESLPLFCWSRVTDSLQSHASCQQRCWVESALVHTAYNGRRMALRLPSARKEVLPPRMLQRLTANVNKTLSHRTSTTRPWRPNYISEKYGQLMTSYVA